VTGWHDPIIVDDAATFNPVGEELIFRRRLPAPPVIFVVAGAFPSVGSAR